MLDGWYCRSIANMQASESASNCGSTSTTQRPNNSQDNYSSDSSSEPEPEINYRSRYLSLKKKLKYLIYENECFQDALKSSQKKLLKVTRDRSYLLDRLLQYEKPDSSTSESDETDSSEDTEYSHVEPVKRKRPDTNATNVSHNTAGSAAPTKPTAAKRRRPPAPKKTAQNAAHPTNVKHPGGSLMTKVSPALGLSLSGAGDGHMTPEEVERHLQSRQSYLELLPERAPPTVPTEMFSNDPSLDSESNDVLENSPNVDEWFD